MTTLDDKIMQEVTNDIARECGVPPSGVSVHAAGWQGSDIQAAFRLTDGRSGNYRYLKNAGQVYVSAYPQGVE